MLNTIYVNAVERGRYLRQSRSARVRTAGTTAQTVEASFDAESAETTDIVAVTNGPEEAAEVMLKVDSACSSGKRA